MTSLRGLVLLVLLGGPQDPGPRIEAMRLVETDQGVDLEIDYDEPPRWTTRQDTGDTVVIRLRGSLPGPRLAALTRDTGLVAEVEPVALSGSRSPETRITVRAREEVKFRLSSADGRLVVHLEPRSPKAPTPEPAVEPVSLPPPPPPPEPSPAPPAEVPAAVPFDDRPAEFRIGPGDVLAIDVFGLQELDRKVRVLRDGQISLPLLGTFQVAGLSLGEAELAIARMLSSRNLVRDPQVSIFVEEFVSRAVSLQGAVVRSGAYQLLGNKTLLEMIGEAGGLREDVGREILVLRGQSAGEQQKIAIDVEALVNRGELSLNIPLRPGDIVMVPHAKELRIYVTGAVERPGAVAFNSGDGITVLQAITAAGGPSTRANMRNVHIIRKLADGTQKRIKVNLKKIRAGKAEDVTLERNDTVVVGEWFL